jgi:hypothetical protein
MTTDLAHYILQTPLMDTHEHLNKEHDYVEKGPDVLRDLFENYVTADLIVAGADQVDIDRLLDSNDPDLERRWKGVSAAWQHCQHTGYGEAVRLIAQQVYGMDEITVPALEQAAARNLQLRQPGQRLRILKDIANLDHVQVDDFNWLALPDLSGPDFFLYDISWADFSSGYFEEQDRELIRQRLGMEVSSLSDLYEAMRAIFAQYGPYAIAVKSQHAYNRTLEWHERSDANAARVLLKKLSDGLLTEDERLSLGDWCLARGVELAIEHNLPFKIHTGYYAGQGYMVTDRIKPGHLSDLLRLYPQARFVLMHIAYPYNDELLAIAKHFPNVYVDLCWSWSINPYAAADFIRRAIHAMPINKIFAFGGDTFWPNAAVAYSVQARKWLTYALQAEINDAFLTEGQAIRVAARLMHENQQACFDLAGKRAAIQSALQ